MINAEVLPDTPSQSRLFPQPLKKYFVRTTPTAQHILGHHPPKADDDVAIEFLHNLRSAQSKTPELGGSAKGENWHLVGKRPAWRVNGEFAAEKMNFMAPGS